eukprot:2447399-Pyramimonas_sp.AAC.1
MAPLMKVFTARSASTSARGPRGAPASRRHHSRRHAFRSSLEPFAHTRFTSPWVATNCRKDACVAAARAVARDMTPLLPAAMAAEC